MVLYNIVRRDEKHLCVAVTFLEGGCLLEKRVLVVRLSALGDVVRTVPAVCALARGMPGVEITWVTQGTPAAMLASQPFLSDVVVYPRSLWGMRDFVKQLRRKRYEIVLDFHGVAKSALVVLLARAERKVGFGKGGSKEMSRFFYDEEVPYPCKMSRYERNMMLVKYLGVSGECSPPFLEIPPEVRMNVSGFLEGVAAEDLVAVHPGTSERAAFKRWMPDRYARLLDELHEMKGTIGMLLWGSASEKEMVERISSFASSPVVLAPPTPTPLHVAALLEGARLYVGPDSAAAHLATLMGTPVVVVMGPTDPVENEPGPYSPHAVVRKDVGCNPCRNRRCSKPVCMEAVEVEDVVNAAVRLLENA